jgi:hypothetical protein
MVNRSVSSKPLSHEASALRRFQPGLKYFFTEVETYNRTFFDGNPKKTGAQQVKRRQVHIELRHLHRSLMRNLGVSVFQNLYKHLYNNFHQLYNLTSTNYLILDFDICITALRRGQADKSLTHLNRYHVQFPLDLQGWPRRWTQTVLFPILVL